MPVTILDHRTSRDHAFAAIFKKALPLLASVAFHGASLGLGFLTYQSVKAIFQPQPQTIIPQTPMLIEQVPLETHDGMHGETDHSGRAGRTSGDNEPAATEWTKEQSRDRSQGLNSTEQNPSANTFIGVGPGTAASIGLPGGVNGERGTGLFGPGLGSGGSSNIFGPTAVRSAHSVAFLCDSSGSMLSKFDALKGELDKAIMSLRPVQSFDIIFFGDNRSISLSPSLIMATPDNKVRATNFLERVTPRGPTDPLPALELAFQQKPRLIFVLTDGDFPDNDAVLKRIRELNRQKSVKINTIAFVGEGDHDIAFITLLKLIAAENGGIYKHVVQNELQ